MPETLTTLRGGLVTLQADGSFVYTPAPNIYGNDRFDYSLLDGHGGFDTGTVRIAVADIVKPVQALSLSGGDQGDNLIGTYLNDTLHGNEGDDVLFGRSGWDKLYGDDGNDVLYGGKGSDTMSGGGNADLFILDGVTNRPDTITDFDAASGDQIQIRDILSFDPLVDAISDFVRMTDQDLNTILSVDADGSNNGESFITVARLSGVNGLNVNQLYADGDLIIQNTV